VGPAIRAVVADACRGRLLGVEREYEIADDQGSVDARRLWPLLPDPGAATDPGDPQARRGPTGGVITADGRHGEVATPPVVLRPGCTDEVLGLAAAGERHLAGQLSHHTLIGYSTHLNVEVPDKRATTVAEIIAHHLALPIMLALDRADSPGLLIRPRPGRLEIGGEFAAGDQLRSALGLAVALVRLAENPTRAFRRLARALPRPEVVPAVERFGWFVDRRAYGPDLYLEGRSTRIEGRSAGTVMAQLWAVARERAVGVLGDDEVELVDAMVTGARAIPMEHCAVDDGPVVVVRDDRSYRPRIREHFDVRVTSATWWRAVLQVDGGRATRWITIPGRALDSVLDALDRGELDAELVSMVNSRRRENGATAFRTTRAPTSVSGSTKRHGGGIRVQR